MHRAQRLMRSMRRAVQNGKRFASQAAEATGEGAGQKWATGVKVNHWASGLGMLATVGCVLSAQQAGKGEFLGKKAGSWMWAHKSFGLLTAGLLAPRVAGRLLSKVPAAVGSNAGLHVVGSAVHYSLYAFTVVMAVSGIRMGYYGGKGLPFFWTSFEGGELDKEAAGQAFSIHKTAGTYGKYLIPLHVGGAGYHVVAGDAIFSRIVPGL